MFVYFLEYVQYLLLSNAVARSSHILRRTPDPPRGRKPRTTYCIWHDFFLQFVFLYLLSKSLWSRLHVDFFSRRVKSTFLQVVDLTTFKVGVESDYIGTGDSHNPTSSQSHGPTIPLPSKPNGNRTGKLRVRVYPRIRSPESGRVPG